MQLVTQIENPASVASSFNPPIGNAALVGVNEESLFSHFIDAQPRLQWLDSDFSAFEQNWDIPRWG
jgi:hypothetical protein